MDMISVCWCILFIIHIKFITATAKTECTIERIHGKLTYANCSNRSLTFVPNDLPENITVLNLGHNNISRIENGTFSKYSALQILRINDNNISVLEPNSFRGLLSLRVLELSGNVLDFREYSSFLFSAIANLTTLDVSRNVPYFDQHNLTYYPDKAFEVLIGLVNLSIDLAPYPVFGKGFKSIARLRTLKFSNCDLLKMDNSTFENFIPELEELHITNCKHFIETEEAALSPFPVLEVLNFSNSYIHPVQAFKLLKPLQDSKMRILNFHHVNDESIADEYEYPFDLTVTRSMMKYIHSICFNVLDISDNNIIDFENESLFGFEKPECVTHINLSNNRISFSKGYRINNIRKFFNRSENLKEVDYSYIPISFVNNPLICPSQLPENVIDLPKSIKTVRMSHVMHGGDPLMWRIPPNNTIDIFDVSFSKTVDQAELSNGSKVNLIDVSGIDAQLVFNQLHLHPLFELHTVIMKQTNLYRIHKEGDNVFAYVPGAEKVDISYNTLWELNEYVFQDMKKLSNLSLSNNLFRAVPLAVTKIDTLKELDLSNNHLTGFNKTIMNYFDKMQRKNGFKLHLNNNAFVCGCSTADFIRWIYESKITFDLKTYKCILDDSGENDTHRVYLDLHYHFSKCKSTVWLRVGVGLIIAFFVIFLPFSLIYSFRWRITFYFYKKIRKVLEKGIHVNFKYDVFIFYSEDLIDWVKETLMPTIECKWGLKMCIEHRDFPCGQPIADAISESIEQSRHIIILVNPSFKDNVWGHYAVERAKYHHFSQNLQKIIIITKDINVEEMPHDLACLWKDFVLVEWPSNNRNVEQIWHKLRLWLFLNCQH